MALELKKKKSEEKPAQKKKAAVEVPSKNTMNFARHESSFNLKKMMPILIVLALVIILFAKFGIIDQYGRKSDALSNLTEKQDQLDAYNLKLKDYDKLANDYGRYSYGWMNEDEVNAVDRLDVIALIDRDIASAATVVNYSINGNTVSTNLSGITLTEASAIVNVLESRELVESAAIHNATAENAEQAQIFMSINLTKEVAE